MHTAARYEIEGAALEDVHAFLGQRPASWLRPFLVLACQSRRSGSDRPWFRVGPLDEDRADLQWRPQAGPAVFERFTGQLAAEPTDRGAALVLAGEVEGGEAEAAEHVLGELLRLLGIALGERQPSG